MIGFATIEDQIAAMATTWPRFRLKARSGRAAIWEGEVCPLKQPFTISIGYVMPLVIELLDLRRIQPRVSVLTPQLRPRRNDPEGQLPHVYYTGKGPLDVILCLFDPDAREWSPAMSIAETTVPWSIDWLFAYEGWRATGEWKATGKHVPPDLMAVA